MNFDNHNNNEDMFEDYMVHKMSTEDTPSSSVRHDYSGAKKKSGSTFGALFVNSGTLLTSYGLFSDASSTATGGSFLLRISQYTNDAPVGLSESPSGGCRQAPCSSLRTPDWRLL